VFVGDREAIETLSGSKARNTNNDAIDRAPRLQAPLAAPVSSA